MLSRRWLALLLTVLLALGLSPAAFADAAQDGSNSGEADQDSDSSSGDASAGSQTFGVVSDGGDTTIRAENRSEGARARSGDAESSNSADMSVGPRVEEETAAGGETFTLSVSTTGSGLGMVSGPGITCGFVLTPPDCAETYPAGETVPLTAVAFIGSSFAGWSGCDSPSGNTCTMTMNADRTVTASFTGLGGLSTSLGGGDAVGASDFEGSVSSVIAQDGDNDLDVSQDGDVATGDAVAGSQAIGVVNTGGDVLIDVSNVSEDADARSGDGELTNTFTGTVGPSVVTGTAAATGFGGPVSSTVAQDGDNTASVDQGGDLGTGDAIAGGQVIGVVATGGTVEIVQSNVSDGDTSETGSSTLDNSSTVVVGPTVPGGGGVFTLSVDPGFSISVDGPGIDCDESLGGSGSDCTESYPGGTVVTLTASSTIIPLFSWSGCDSVSPAPFGPSCTVTMNADRSVSVTLGL